MTALAPSPLESQAAMPLRTWRPMVGWTLGILLALGLAWFVATLVSSVRRTHAVLDQVYRTGYTDQAAAAAVAQLGGPESTVRAIRLYLSMPERVADRWWSATLTLGYCGGRAVPTLRGKLTTENRFVRYLAAEALGKLGTLAEEAVPELEAAARSEDWHLRSRATAALCRVDRATDDRLAVLIQDLESPQADRRRVAVYLIGYVGVPARATIPVLRKALLDDEDLGVRHSVAVALGNMGPEAARVVSELERVKDNEAEHSLVRDAAAEALKKIQGEEPPK